MKSTLFCILTGLTIGSNCLAMEDKTPEAPLPKPCANYDDIVEDQETDLSDPLQGLPAPQIPHKQMVSNNPIAPAGISISEFLDYGMVHVEDPNLLLSQPGGTDKGSKSNPAENIRRFYIHHIASGAARKGNGQESREDKFIEILNPDEAPQETEEENGPDDMEEETDLSKLASRNKRG